LKGKNDLPHRPIMPLQFPFSRQVLSRDPVHWNDPLQTKKATLSFSRRLLSIALPCGMISGGQWFGGSKKRVAVFEGCPVFIS